MLEEEEEVYLVIQLKKALPARFSVETVWDQVLASSIIHGRT
jgi:hypothetical protein